MIFEPYGVPVVKDQLKIYNLIWTNLRNQYGSSIQEEAITNITSMLRPQKLSETQKGPEDTHVGYCVAWSLWFFSLILHNPTITAGHLFDMAHKSIQQKSQNFRTICGKYCTIIRNGKPSITKPLPYTSIKLGPDRPC